MKAKLRLLAVVVVTVAGAGLASCSSDSPTESTLDQVLVGSRGAGGDSVGGDSIIASGQYRDAVNDKSSKGWREAISGYEEVESPSTGQRYDAPLNSWNASGPDGAGYYRQLPDGSSEKLDSTD